MTEVLILKRIAGHRAGDVVELTDRLRKHVAAGNAQALPDADEFAETAPLHAVPDADLSDEDGDYSESDATIFDAGEFED